jgi:hypothetical protein
VAVRRASALDYTLLFVADDEVAISNRRCR